MGVAALAAALRWFRIDAQSLWYDEGISAHQLTRSFAEILNAAAMDTHPPLYYWTLKAWAEISFFWKCASPRLWRCWSFFSPIRG